MITTTTNNNNNDIITFLTTIPNIFVTFLAVSLVTILFTKSWVYYYVKPSSHHNPTTSNTLLSSHHPKQFSNEAMLCINQTPTTCLLTCRPKFTLQGDDSVSVLALTETFAFVMLLSSGKFALVAFALRDGKELGRFDAHANRALAVACYNTSSASNNNTVRVLLAMLDGRIMVLDFHTIPLYCFTIGRILTNHTDAARAVAFLNSPQAIVSGGWDQIINVFWDIEQENEEPLVLRGHTSDVNCVGYCSVLDVIVSGSTDRTLRTWHVQRRAHKQVDAGFVFRGHTDSIRTLDVNGTRCCTGSFDFTVRVIDLLTSTELTKINLTWFVQSVAWCRNDSILCGTLDNSAILFDLSLLDHDKPLLTIKHSEGVNAVACDPRGRYALTGSETNSCFCWDLRPIERTQMLVVCGGLKILPVDLHKRIATYLF